MPCTLRRPRTSSCPLYRGTWYHLAVTLTGGEMTILVDGVVVASQQDPSFLPRTGTQALRIGFDTVTNTCLKGTVDEVAVYSTLLQTSEIAAIRTFVQGVNAIVVPRGLFYESLLNQTLGGPDARAANPALLKVTVHANQFATDGPVTLDAYLNGRPIQQVISGNLTLAEAQWFADQLTANRSLARSAFLFPVHREFWTMGFDPAVILLTPNAIVANSGNFSAPAAPREWWEQIWNSVVGFASAVWNAAVAVATFFVALGMWLVDAVVGLVIGLATGDWTYFQEKVVKPFVEAMMRLIQFIIDMVVAFANFLFSPLIEAFEDWKADVASATISVVTGRHTLASAVPTAVAPILFGPFPLLLTAVILALALFVKYIAVIGFGFLVKVLIAVIVAAYIAVQIASVAAAFDLIGEINQGFDTMIDWAFGAVDFFLALALTVYVWKKGLDILDKAGADLIDGILAFVMLGVAGIFKATGTVVGYFCAFVMDVVAMVLAFGGHLTAKQDGALEDLANAGNPTASALAPIAKVIELAAQITAVSSVFSDLGGLAALSARK